MPLLGETDNKAIRERALQRLAAHANHPSWPGVDALHPRARTYNLQRICPADVHRFVTLASPA